MKLATALRLKNNSKVAFVGAGGKTSGIFIVARQLLEAENGINSILVSTTTRMGLFQAKYADRHIIVESGEQLLELQRDFPRGSVLVTGSPVEGKHLQITRLNGIPAEDMLTLASRHSIPLLIEADGARMLPLKAPAPYEPVIPEFVDTVVVLAALSGLGKPLSKEWVHRPEIFSELAGLPIGENITAEALIRVLKHRLGGLKNIPPQARRIMLFNQVDTVDLQSIARGMAPALLEEYQTVVVGSYGQPLARNVLGDKIESLPSEMVRKTTENEAVICTHERIAGVILAAGESKRYGQPKQLLEWQGQPLIRRAAETALAAGLSPVIVVTGAADRLIRQAIQELPVQVVNNPDWQKGQSTSVISGLASLQDNINGCMFLLADQPYVTENLVRSLVNLHAATLSPISAPQVAGQRANPVLFDRVAFTDLRALTGDQGGKSLFSRYSTTWLPWEDNRLTLDIDTPEDYQRLLEE